MAQAKYVNYGGEQVYPQPFRATDLKYYGFFLKANETCLQSNFCDKILNAPSENAVSFSPIGPYVMLVFCEMPVLQSTTPPFNGYGGFSEKEVAIWVPVKENKTMQPAWLLPYIYVDNAYALSMGREIYGFPKELARFEFPNDPPGAGHFSAETLVLKEFGPKMLGKWEPLFQVQKSGGEKEKTPHIWNTLEEVGKEAFGDFIHGDQSIIKDLELLFNILNDLIHLRLPFVFLKQFRDIVHAEKACYQAIVQAAAKMVKFRGAGLYDDAYEIAIGDYASQPILRDLGLPKKNDTSLLSFWINFDFLIGNGSVLWEK